MFAIIAGLAVAGFVIYAVSGTNSVAATTDETNKLREEWAAEKAEREAAIEAKKEAIEAAKPKYKYYDFASELTPQQELAEEIAKRQPVINVNPVVIAI